MNITTSKVLMIIALIFLIVSPFVGTILIWPTTTVAAIFAVAAWVVG